MRKVFTGSSAMRSCDATATVPVSMKGALPTPKLSKATKAAMLAALTLLNEENKL